HSVARLSASATRCFPPARHPAAGHQGGNSESRSAAVGAVRRPLFRRDHALPDRAGMGTRRRHRRKTSSRQLTEGNVPLLRTKAASPLVVFFYLAVIITTWAGNWPLMKIALGQVPPLVFVLFRLIGSLALIAPVLIATRQPLLPVRGERLFLFWVGELQVAGFLICSIIGLAILPAGRAIVLAFTMPLWAIPIGL